MPFTANGVGDETEEKDKNAPLTPGNNSQHSSTGTNADGSVLFWKGPSGALDYFHSDGSPRITEDPVIPGSYRPDSTAEDGISKKMDDHLGTVTMKVRTGVAAGGGVGGPKISKNIIKGTDKDAGGVKSKNPSSAKEDVDGSAGEIRSELIVSIPRLALYDHPELNKEEILFSSFHDCVNRSKR